MKRRALVTGLWVTPVVSTVLLPTHAETSSENDMASGFFEESGWSTGCFEEAEDADAVFDGYTYENGSNSEAIIKGARIGNPAIWNLSISLSTFPATIKPGGRFSIERGFHLPASDPLDYSGSQIDITFSDGSILIVPRVNC